LLPRCGPPLPDASHSSSAPVPSMVVTSRHPRRPTPPTIHHFSRQCPMSRSLPDHPRLPGRPPWTPRWLPPSRQGSGAVLSSVSLCYLTTSALGDFCELCRVMTWHVLHHPSSKSKVYHGLFVMLTLVRMILSVEEKEMIIIWLLYKTWFCLQQWNALFHLTVTSS
jgi:hypothetical protein